MVAVKKIGNFVISRQSDLDVAVKRKLLQYAEDIKNKAKITAVVAVTFLLLSYFHPANFALSPVFSLLALEFKTVSSRVKRLTTDQLLAFRLGLKEKKVTSINNYLFQGLPLTSFFVKNDILMSRRQIGISFT